MVMKGVLGLLQAHYVEYSRLQSKYRIGKDVEPMYITGYDVVLNRMNTLTEGLKFRIVSNRVGLTDEQLAIIAMDGAAYSSFEIRGNVMVIKTSGGLMR